jgi:hypothetical protein
MGNAPAERFLSFRGDVGARRGTALSSAERQTQTAAEALSPRCRFSVSFRPLDHSEEPQDKDQKQQTAETDIHNILRFGFAHETVRTYSRSSRFGTDMNGSGYYFTRPEHAGFA